MKLDRVSRAALRISMQLNTSPGSVASAIAWRAVRRPVLRLCSSLASQARREPAAPLRSRLHWAEALLATSLPPPPPSVARIVGAPCIAFGRSWNASPEVLSSIDPRFGVEAWRLQHLHALAAMCWHARHDGSYGAEIASALDRPVEVLLAQSIREALGAQTARIREAGVAPYPMDHGMRAVSLLLAYTALSAGSAARRSLAIDEDFSAAVATLVSSTIDLCFSDPEYSGKLSNNHHLTTVACLLVLLASLQGSVAGRDSRAQLGDLRFDTATRWLVRAAKEQFDRDGVHFEYSTGYHMCSVETLALAGLAFLEPPTASGTTPIRTAKDRWERLLSGFPEVAGSLASAVRFAEAVTRPDGTYPLLGDFDASRILRTRAVYRAEAPEDDAPPVRTPMREQFSDGMPGGPGLEATLIEVVDANATSALVRALFALPDPVRKPPGELDRPVSVQPARAILPVSRGESFVASSTPLVSTAPAEADLRSMTELVRSTLGSRAGAAVSGVQYRFVLPAAPGAGVEILAFPQAGLLVARASTLLATLSSGTPGQHGMGTHSHLDHLASDIWIDGGACIADPGSWCYGSSVPLRNRYRSNTGHFSPLWQLDWSQVLQHPFCLRHAPHPALLGSDASSIWGVMRLPSGWVCRRIAFQRGAIVVLDASSEPGLSPYPLQQLPVHADGYFGPLQRVASIPEISTCAA